MTTEKSPTLAMLYPLATDKQEFQSFRDDVRGYLKKHGIPQHGPVYDSLTSVSRGGLQSKDSLVPVVKAILTETGNGESGPRGPLAPHLPLLTAFHRKYVAKQPVEWGPYLSIEDALVEELYGAGLVW